MSRWLVDPTKSKNASVTTMPFDIYTMLYACN